MVAEDELKMNNFILSMNFPRATASAIFIYGMEKRKKKKDSFIKLLV